MVHEQQLRQQPASRVYLIEYDPAMRQSLTRLVESIGFPAIAFEKADLFFKNYAADRPACLVSNVRVRHRRGIETLEEIRRLRMPTPVIFVTDIEDVDLAVEAMQLGAVGFLPQPIKPKKFLDLVSKAARFAIEFDRFQAEFGQVEQLFARLSEREQQVMAKLLDGEEADSIANVLHISRKTVDFHRRNLFEKLGAANTAALSRLYWQHTYARVWLDSALAYPAWELPTQLPLPLDVDARSHPSV